MEYDSQVIVANHVRGVMETHAETRRAQKKAESDFNLKLAEEQRARKKEKLTRDAEADMRHVDTVMCNPMLNENVDGMTDQYGNPVRSLKGMSSDQKYDCYYYNALQMQHKRN